MSKVNEYFDGAVKSLTFEDNGRSATVGVMEAGEYAFGTSQHETMRVLSGVLEAKMPGESDYTAHAAGAEFEVEAGITFNVRLSTQVAYVCYYD